MKSFTLLSAAALITSTASATFTGLTVETAFDAGTGRNVYSIFANFSLSNDRILNVFDFTNVAGSMSALHNDNCFGDIDTDGDGYADLFGATGAWSQTWNSSAGIPSDSYVMIGSPGPVALDPGFTEPYGHNVNGTMVNTGIVNLSGWYDSTPGSQNLAGATLKIKVMQIARLAAGETTYVGRLNVGYGAFGTTTPLFSGNVTYTLRLDSDGDGVHDAQDNCPTISNPNQANNDGDAQGDVCDLDDDNDGVPDTADNCQFTSNPGQADCNSTGIGDACETILDCNNDQIPDTCQGAVIVAATSGNLGPPSGDQARVFTFTNLTFAETAVTLLIDVRGDLNGTTEWIDVSLNGTAPRRFFDGTGNDCPSTPDRATIVLTRPEFAALLGAGSSLTVTLTCPATVDPTECKGTGLTEFQLAYVGIDPATGDCNGDHRLDVCAIADGTSPDCNSNFIPDSCDLIAPLFRTASFTGATGSPLSYTESGITFTSGQDHVHLGFYPGTIQNHGNCCTTPITITATEPQFTLSSLVVYATSNTGRLVGSNGAIVILNHTGLYDFGSTFTDVAWVRWEETTGGGLGAPGSHIDSLTIVVGGPGLPDCNSNGIPDSCDVASGGAPDCNSNGIPDSCDVASGTSADRDGNMVPDSCQTVTVPGNYATIQAAITSAPASVMRIVSLGAGSFAGPVDFMGKPIVIRGVSATSTIIAGTTQGLSVVRFTGEPAIAALENVTVRNGNTGSTHPLNSAALVGGGIFLYNSAASLRDCIIESNTSGFGGGIYAWYPTGKIERCIIRNNAAAADGGGMQAFGGSITVVDSLIENNYANSRGGGVHFVIGTPRCDGTTIRTNSSNNSVGGLSWVPADSAGAFLTIDDCDVTGNTADIDQGGIGIVADNGAAAKTSLIDTVACNNSPRHNITGWWTDLGGNTICDCFGDVSNDGVVNGVDLAMVLTDWGVCSGYCETDIDRDGEVDGGDLASILTAWGVCPN